MISKNQSFKGTNPVFKIPINITTEQLDPNYRHVHHCTIAALFEKARIALLESVGYSQAQLFSLDLWAVISEIHVEYTAEVTEGEYFASCDSIIMEKKRMVFNQRLINSSGEEYAQAKVKIMWYSKKAGKSVMLPKEILVRLGVPVK